MALDKVPARVSGCLSEVGGPLRYFIGSKHGVTEVVATATETINGCPSDGNQEQRRALDGWRQRVEGANQYPANISYG